MNVHLVDGTFELYRAHFGAPSARTPDGKREVGAVRGLLRSLAVLLRQDDVSHVGIAFDHVIESFRNDLYSGYKTGEGMDPELFGQFALAERGAAALGLVVWPMVEFEADDALASAAHEFADRDEVEQVVICSPDKDLCQCVRGDRVVTYDRMRRRLTNAEGVVAKFGVAPESIPDWLALVGDAADGIPGIPRWGAKSAAKVLAHYRHIDAIPDRVEEWRVSVRGAAGLATNLREHRAEAGLFRELATLRIDVPLGATLDEMVWRGAARDEVIALCEELGEDRLVTRISQWRD